MGTRPPVNGPAQMPWTDRGNTPAVASPSPRSQRDLELLRALARRINPQDAGAHNNLGVVYYNKGLYDDAVRHFEWALDIDPRMQVAERNLQISYFGTGHFERLTAELSARLDRDPADVEARDQLARTYYNSGRLAEAVEELGLLLAARPREAAVYQRLARAELKRGNLDAAMVTLRNAEKLDPHNARIQFMIGEVLYQRGMSGEAMAPLERAVALDDGLADAYHLLAFVYGDQGATEQANEAAARAAELNPSYAKAEAGLSLDSYSTARYEELVGSRGASGPAVAEGGELAHYNLGLAFRQKALYDEALREFRLATERGEDPHLVQQAQAEMLLLRGDGEALDLYHALISQESSSPKLWNELGVSLHQAGSLQRAEEAYGRALEIDPHYALAWNNLAVVRHHRGDRKAESSFRSAASEGRASADVWRNYALMLHREGRRDESAAAYESAIAANAASAQACTGYGILLMEMSRAADARNQLLRAVEIDPELPEARYHLAFALSALGDYDGALRETQLALELNPFIPTPRFKLLIDLQFEEASVLAPELDPATQVSGADAIQSFHFQPTSLDAVFEDATSEGHIRTAAAAPGEELLNSARAALEQGRLEEAGADAHRAGMYGASRIDVLVVQGEVYLRRGYAGEAVERFDEALSEIARDAGAGDNDEPLRRALHGAARSLLDLGRLGEAVEAAERLCELVPGDAEALRTLGETLSRVKDHGRAAIVLEHARMTAPNDVNLLTQLGAAYAAAGDPDGAESALRRAIEQDDRAVGARVCLAGVLAEDDRTNEAEEQYRQALAVLPSYGQAAFGLASLEESRGNLRGAMHVMVDLLSTDPYRMDALMRLGGMLEAAGREDHARFAYERVLRFEPTHGQARNALERLTSSDVQQA